MKSKLCLLTFAALAIFFSACKQTDFKKTKDGLPYKIFSSGSGEKIQPGYFVSLHQTMKLKDSILQTSYGQMAQIVPIPKDSGAQMNSLMELLLQARKGDSIQVNQPVDSIIKKDPRAATDSLLSKNRGESIVYIFKIVDVYKTQEEASAMMEKQEIETMNTQPAIVAQKKKDDAEIEAYLKAHNIQAQKSPWGVYVQTVTPGSGPKPKSGQYAMLRYTGKDLAGNVFDATEKHGGQLLPLQIGTRQSIPGFEDGVKQMSKGEKAIIYIPSVVGYGAQGQPPTIQPNQNLVFELELVDITDHMPLPSTPATPDSTRK